MTGGVREANLENLSKGLAVVEVYKQGCTPCKQLQPILNTLSSEYSGKISFYKANFANESVMRSLGEVPHETPTLFLLKDGKVLEHFTGAKFSAGVGSKRVAAGADYLKRKINRVFGEYIAQPALEEVVASQDINLAENSLITLRERYLKKDDQGKVIETPKDLFIRVARNIAEADKNYHKSQEEINQTQKSFYEIMSNLQFVPNSPTLMNAGRDLQQLSACFVLPIEDSIESIFGAAGEGALVHKSGGGTGYSFSRLRPKNSRVKSTSGVASGPVSFMYAFNVYTDVVKQGGTRRGANMGVLRVDHPDIQEFIHAKGELDSKNKKIVDAFKEENNLGDNDPEVVTLTRKLLETTQLNNLNISVGITKKFMDAVKKNSNFSLINPSDKKEIKKIKARALLDEIVDQAWKTGDPGVIFIDRMNEYNPTPHIGEIESTNPCGEQPLLPYESCNLGSINLTKFVNNDEIDYANLGKVVDTAVHFLDNVIDMNKYPIPKIDEMTKANRKIGLGVMGFADMLSMLKIQYGSEDSFRVAEKVMKFVRDEARKASIKLAEERGVFPNWKGSIYDPSSPHFKGEELKLRNATLTTLAPTGTISMIANCESGIEPPFSLVYTRTVMDGKVLHYGPRGLEYILKKEGFDTEEIFSELNEGKKNKFNKLPKEIRRIAVTSMDLTPEQHIKVQAAFQKYTDNAVSKTINLPNSATRKDIKQAYLLAYKLGCKGITIYRDGSKDVQVLERKIVKKYKYGSRLPKERIAIVRQENVGEGKKIFVTQGFWETPATERMIAWLRRDGKTTEFFINANFFDSKTQCDVVGMAIRCSKDMRKGISLEEIAEDLVNLPPTDEVGYDEINGQKYVNRSVFQAVGRAILGWEPPALNHDKKAVTAEEKPKIRIPEEVKSAKKDKSSKKQKEETYKTNYRYCSNCGKYGVEHRNGCDKCIHCHFSVKGCPQ